MKINVNLFFFLFRWGLVRDVCTYGTCVCVLVCLLVYAAWTIDETILSEDPPTETSKQEIIRRQSTLIIIGAGAIATLIIVTGFMMKRSRKPRASPKTAAATEAQSSKRLK